MERIVPITDLQRQAGQIVSEIAESGESVIVTQRGRPAAVLVSVARYAEIEQDLAKLDELELLEMVAQSREAIATGESISHDEVARRIRDRAAASAPPKNVRRR